MKKKLSPILALLLVIAAVFFGIPNDAEVTETYSVEAITVESTQDPWVQDDGSTLISADGSYTSKEDVSLYLYTYGCLPENFITKDEARELGWEGGGLDDFAPGMCIGGDRFGNYEGLLPEEYDYLECDIDTLGAEKRGAKRLVFSEDCQLIYYTEDHYESFELLYGEP